MTASQQSRSLRKSLRLLLGTLLLAASAAATAAESTVTSATAEMLVVTSTGPEPDQDLLDKLAATLAANHVQTDKFDAQVWLMSSESRLRRYMDAEADRLALLQLVYREANRVQLDPDLVLAVMQVH